MTNESGRLATGQGQALVDSGRDGRHLVPRDPSRIDTMPLVSILIPCFNAERHVAAAIDSAFAQTHPEVEVIVVDDGSTDASRSVIQRYADRPGFRYETGPNRGGNATRNRLLQLARGEYVQFLDADDVLHDAKVAVCLAALTPDLDMVFAEYVERSGHATRPVSLPDPGQDLVEYFIRHNVQTSLPLHRAAHLRASGGFHESLRCCQEHEFHLRLARTVWKRVRRIPRALCTVNRVPGSVSSNDARVYDTLCSIMTDACASLREQDEITPARADAIAGQLLTCSRHLARHDRADRALSAYRLARSIAPGTIGPYSPAMRVLVAVVGPVWAERCRGLFS